MAHASYGILSGVSDYQIVKAHERDDCIDSLISTAIVNVNKELGGSRSSDLSVHQGYEKYRELVTKQIHAYAPDLVIACMVGTNENLKPIVDSVYKTYTGESKYTIIKHSKPSSANVAWSKSGCKTFLWAYHPSYTRLISDSDYFNGLMNAYNESLNHQKTEQGVAGYPPQGVGSPDP